MQTSGLNVSSPRELGREYFNSPVSQNAETPASISASSTAIGSPNAQDELFLNLPSPFSPQNANDSEEGSVSYVPAEPIIAESDIEDTDWTIYEPPAEFLRPQEGTSVIIESILVPSIIRIRQQQDGEEARRRASSFAQTPLGRSRSSSNNINEVSREQPGYTTRLTRTRQHFHLLNILSILKINRQTPYRQVLTLVTQSCHRLTLDMAPHLL
jgi:hypothetical protein